jgi:hypothetical protein
MARSSKAAPFATLQAVRRANDARWSVPRAAVFVTGASLLLWALIFAGARWLIG